MKFNHALKAVALAAAFGLGGAASAANLTTPDGVKAFTGFDWSDQGTAFTSGFTGSNTTANPFQLEFFSHAQTIKNGPNNVLGLANLNTNATGGGGGYEYTVYAKIFEVIDPTRSTNCGTLGGVCAFTVVSGEFFVYFGSTANANKADGTGYKDGIEIIRGTITAGQDGGTFTSFGLNGSGNSNLQGSVTVTNSAYINPDLISTVVGTTLQIGGSVTNGYTAPTGFNGTAFGQGNIVFQADGNQSFTSSTVPEPGSMALVALTLLSGGVVGARRRKADQK